MHVAEFPQRISTSPIGSEERNAIGILTSLPKRISQLEYLLIVLISPTLPPGGPEPETSRSGLGGFGFRLSPIHPDLATHHPRGVARADSGSRLLGLEVWVTPKPPSLSYSNASLNLSISIITPRFTPIYAYDICAFYPYIEGTD